LQFSLRPMAPETVLAHLKQVLAQEQVPAEEGALRLIARGARGSMRDALSLTDQAIAFGAGALQEAQVRQMLGAVDRSYVFRLIEALAVGDGKAVFGIAQALRDNGLSAASSLEDMAAVLQRMAVCQQMPGSHDVQDSEAVEIARLATLMPPEETQLLYSIAIHGRAELGLAPDEYTGLIMSLLRLLAFKPKGFKPANLGGESAVHAASAATDQAEKKSLNPEPAVASVDAPVAPPVAPSVAPITHVAPEASSVSVAMADVPQVNIEEPKQPLAPVYIEKFAIENVANTDPPTLPTHLMAVPIREQSAASSRLDARITAVEPDAHHEAWVQLVQQLLDAQAVQGMVQQLAVQSQCVEKGASHLTLLVGQPSLKSDSTRNELQAALANMGRHEALVIEVGPVQDSWAKRNTAKLEARQKAAEALITQDPWVQELVAQWGAKIVPGSIKAV
jgi:DNA polymerase III subunit gamma/tau